MKIPERCSPADEEARRDRRYVEWMNRQPRCMGCGQPITTELYLDLEPFGIDGRACECCRSIHTHFTEGVYE